MGVDGRAERGCVTTYEYRTTIEVDVLVTYGRDPYRPAQTMGPVESCHPAEGGGVIDLRALLGGLPVLMEADLLLPLLGDKAYAALEDELHAHADDEDRYDDGDRRRDEMRDDEMTGDR